MGWLVVGLQEPLRARSYTLAVVGPELEVGRQECYVVVDQGLSIIALDSRDGVVRAGVVMPSTTVLGSESHIRVSDRTEVVWAVSQYTPRPWIATRDHPRPKETLVLLHRSIEVLMHRGAVFSVGRDAKGRAVANIKPGRQHHDLMGGS